MTSLQDENEILREYLADVDLGNNTFQQKNSASSMKNYHQRHPSMFRNTSHWEKVLCLCDIIVKRSYSERQFYGQPIIGNDLLVSIESLYKKKRRNAFGIHIFYC